MIGAAQAQFDPDVEEVLMRVYHVDPHSITLRRLQVLVRRLPLGDWKKDRGPASWSEEAYLLANVVDAVNQVAWITAQANSRRRIQPPKPLDRPGHSKTTDRVPWKAFTDTMAGMEGVIIHDDAG